MRNDNCTSLQLLCQAHKHTCHAEPLLKLQTEYNPVSLACTVMRFGAICPSRLDKDARFRTYAIPVRQRRARESADSMALSKPRFEASSEWIISAPLFQRQTARVVAYLCCTLLCCSGCASSRRNAKDGAPPRPAAASSRAESIAVGNDRPTVLQ